MAKEPPLGVRLNNFGNIRKTKDRFDGEVIPSSNEKFKEFDSPVKGLRALAKILMTYYSNYDLDTVEKIIPRYAPRNENNTKEYIRVVAAKCAVSPDEVLSIDNPGTLLSIMKGIVAMEVGYKDSSTRTPWADDYAFMEAIKQAKS